MLSLLHANGTRLSRADYIARYRHIAIDHQQRYGIPASITMAQGILESDSGNSLLSKSSNNHFGIKCKSTWRGRTFYYTDDAPDECFRAYPNVEASYQDHAEFLESSPRYDSLFAFSPTDYRSWARGLKGAGYATAPDYTQRLIKLIEDNKLYELDLIAAGSAPINKGKSFSDTERYKKATLSVNPNNSGVGYETHDGYSIHKTNRRRYIVLQSGDRLDDIASHFYLSKSRLRRYNDLERNQVLSDGDPIFIEPKRSRWSGNTHTHTMLKGETLHSVSQLYGIKESSLIKINNLDKKPNTTVGMVIRLK